MREVTIRCDITECTNIVETEEGFRQRNITVISTNILNQPLVDCAKLDLCTNCHNKVLEGNMIFSEVTSVFGSTNLLFKEVK